MSSHGGIEVLWVLLTESELMLLKVNGKLEPAGWASVGVRQRARDAALCHGLHDAMDITKTRPREA